MPPKRKMTSTKTITVVTKDEDIPSENGVLLKEEEEKKPKETKPKNSKEIKSKGRKLKSATEHEPRVMRSRAVKKKKLEEVESKYKLETSKSTKAADTKPKKGHGAKKNKAEGL